MAPKSFADFPIDRRLVAALADDGITHPFPIQELTLPLALQGADVIGQARTGTGKTLAFGLAVLQRIDPDADHTQALIVVPTRELCLQVTEDMRIGEVLGVRVVSVYGGVGYDKQIEALTTGVHVVVGTPGRLLDHLNKGNLDLSQAKLLVLDEADEMLDMGFLPDVERLIDATQEEGRHTLLFSATMPREVVSLARKYMTHPTFMRADTEDHEVAPTVEQYFFQVHRMDKPRILARILQSAGRGGCYVFVRTKAMADRLVRELDDLSVEAVALHGDLRQSTREKNMDIFREGKADVLVATEVAARGLDVENITHVVNYDCPEDEKMYLHRIGRTARAGNEGVAVTFAEFNEIERLNMIRRAVDADRGIDEVFSTSPLLGELFELPQRTPWDRFSPDESSTKRPRSSQSDRGSGGESRSKDRGKGGGKHRGGKDGGGRQDRAGSGGRGQTDGRDKDGAGRTKRDDDSEVARARTRTRARTGGGGQRPQKPAADGRSEKPAAERRSEKPAAERRSEKPAAERRSEKPTAERTRKTVSEGGDDGSGRARTRARSSQRSGSSGSRSSGSGSSGSGGSGRTRARRTDTSNEREGGGRAEHSGSKRSGSRSSASGSRSSASRGARTTRPTGDLAEPSRTATAAERTTDRGDDARGGGVPRLERRVEVEHLP